MLTPPLVASLIALEAARYAHCLRPTHLGIQGREGGDKIQRSRRAYTVWYIGREHATEMAYCCCVGKAWNHFHLHRQIAGLCR